jgi:hypothetical protein
MKPEANEDARLTILRKAFIDCGYEERIKVIDNSIYIDDKKIDEDYMFIKLMQNGLWEKLIYDIAFESEK